MEQDADDRTSVGGGCLDVLDGIEFLFYATIALIVLGLVWFGSLRILVSSFGFAGGLVFVAWTVLAAFIIARDAIRRRWSPVSIAAAVAYALSLCAVIAGAWITAPPAS